MTSTETPTRARGISRRVKAILAGGLVLGVGAAVTLAAWNDSEFVSGQFSAGSFNLEGSTVSGTTGFAEHATDGTAAVLFQLSSHDNVSPGETFYQPFWVRLAAGTTSAADLSLAAVTGSGDNAAHMSYAIYELAAIDTACGAAGIAGLTPIASGDDLTEITTNPGTTLAVGTPTSNPGAAINLCFVVTTGADLEQGDDAEVIWELEATSN